MLKKYLFLLAVLISFNMLAQEASIDINDPRLAGLDEELDSILNNFKVAGFAVAVVDKDQVLYAKGFGYRDLENEVKADANTLFAIGSCSKAFTSSMLGILRKEEKVDFDESPITYLPKLRFYNDELNNFVTVKDLMCHRTGLPRHDASWYFFPTDSEAELVERLQYQEPTAGLRQVWQYNNFMFLLQGEITAAQTGMHWKQAMKKSIMDPLGMERTNFSIPAMEKDENASLGYQVKDQEIDKMDYYKIRAMGAAGSINSSVNEMAKWARLWINGGKWGEEEIIPEDYIKEAAGPQMVISSALPSKEHPDLHISTYGYGWFNLSYRGHYRVEHGGNIDGFSASTCFFPSDSLGVVVLVNQNGSSVTGLVRNIVIDRMLELDRIDWHKEMKERFDKAIAPAEEAEEGDEEETEEEEEAGVPSAHALEDFVGLFAHPGYGEARVSMENDSLFLELPEEKFWLRHHTFDIFHPIHVDDIQDEDAPPFGGISLNFQTDANGKVPSVLIPLEGGLDAFSFKRKVEAKEIDAKDLEKYVGEYELAPGVAAKFYIKDETTLYAFIQGQPEYELVPTGEHAFALKVLDGYSVEFTEAEDGSITHVSFVQPNGTFKAKRKE